VLPRKDLYKGHPSRAAAESCTNSYSSSAITAMM